MPTWYINGRRIIRKPEITPSQRPFAQQLRDEVCTILAWAIPLGILILLVIAWSYR